jgi:hypothetical protein
VADRFGWRDAVEISIRIQEMIQRQPDASRMVEEQERKDDRKRQPEGELLIDRHGGKNIEDKKAGNRDRHGSRIVDIDRAHEIALLPFELQTAMAAVGMHLKKPTVQRTDTAAGALKAQPISDPG